MPPAFESSLAVASVVSDSETPWTVAHQASLSMGFPRQEYESARPPPTPRALIQGPVLRVAGRALGRSSCGLEVQGAGKVQIHPLCLQAENIMPRIMGKTNLKSLES